MLGSRARFNRARGEEIGENVEIVIWLGLGQNQKYVSLRCYLEYWLW